MTQLYQSTRNKNLTATSAQAVLDGLAPDGGLYVLPLTADLSLEAEDLISKSYEEIALAIMAKLLPDFPPQLLQSCIHAAYHQSFSSDSPAPLKRVGDAWILELFHGPTSAFKDVALTFLPHLMKEARHLLKDPRRVLILTATSGDTGKAALEGFRDVEGTGILVFYPHGGVSTVQQLQMSTQEGKNTFVCAIEGNFDDAQRGVKILFEDRALEEELLKQNIILSSANSINIGRLIPQIVYYFYAYAQLRRHGAIAKGENMHCSVPTGNFGNILALYLAKKMGLPCGKLVCASNANNVLWEFLSTGVYNRSRPFLQTTSPSMDILISSNLERLLYYISDEDAQQVQRWMEDLKTKGRYELTPTLLAKLQEDFAAGWTEDQEGKKTIRRVFEKHGYLMDPHTAIAWQVMENQNLDGAKVIVSTASPYKFTNTVWDALYGPAPEDVHELELLKKLEEKTGTLAPAPLSSLGDKEVRFRDVIPCEGMKDYVRRISKKF